MQVNVKASLGPSWDELAELEFVVDTGSFWSAVSPEIGRELRLPQGMPAQVMMADSRIVDTEVTLAYVHLLERRGIIPVEVIEVPVPLLGVSALETLGMKVNPVSGELEVVRPFEAPPMFSASTSHDRQGRGGHLHRQGESGPVCRSIRTIWGSDGLALAGRRRAALQGRHAGEGELR